MVKKEGREQREVFACDGSQGNGGSRSPGGTCQRGQEGPREKVAIVEGGEEGVEEA